MKQIQFSTNRSTSNLWFCHEWMGFESIWSQTKELPSRPSSFFGTQDANEQLWSSDFHCSFTNETAGVICELQQGNEPIAQVLTTTWKITDNSCEKTCSYCHLELFRISKAFIDHIMTVSVNSTGNRFATRFCASLSLFLCLCDQYSRFHQN